MDRFISKVVDKVTGDDDDDKKQTSQGESSFVGSPFYPASILVELPPFGTFTSARHDMVEIC